MSAEIAVIEGAAAMMYQGATPWHALGTRLPEGHIDVPAALTAAHLDWDVALRPLYYRDGKNLAKVPGRRAVVRTDGTLLSTVGGDYTPLQNSEAFGVLQPACEQFGLTIETAGALGRGDRVWMLAKMPDHIEPVAGDRIEGYLLITSGHNGWTPYTGRLTPTRVVCQNTLSLALRDQAFTKLRHTTNDVARIDQVAHLVTDTVAALKATGETFGKLAKTAVSEAEMREYISRVLGVPEVDANPVADRRRATILELATKSGKGIEAAPGTLWAVYNAVTEYIDHVRPAEAKALRTIKQANESALFGANAKLKVKALQLATKLAA